MLWTKNLAYGVGLITTDGNLSKDGRHILFVSKDIEQMQNLVKVLKLTSKIRPKVGGYTNKEDYFALQFSDVKLYNFLQTVGLKPNKSKTLEALSVPDEFFADFLRGCFDGDGFSYSYMDKRWKSSFMLYTGFTCASTTHLKWLNDRIYQLFEIKGTIKTSGKTAYQLMFAKRSSQILIKKLYYNDNVVCLSRKKLKIDTSLSKIISL